MHHYIALVHRSEGGAYGASFPDWPGCIAVEDDFEKVLETAARALRIHAEGMAEDGEDAPHPRSYEEIQADPEFVEDLEDATVALVPLHPPRGRTVRLNISMDECLLSNIDQVASAQGLSRSAFLAEAAQRVIREET